MNKLKKLDNKDDFARLLGFKNSTYINYILYNIGTDNLYRTFSIPKKNGGTRLVHAPKPELKFLQKKLVNVLWDCYVDDLTAKSKEKNFKIPMLSHAFEKNKSIITNAQVHRNKQYILNIDLKDYFESFNFGRVRGFFIKDKDFQVVPEVATVIAQIACYQGKLPQGAPSSPIITNLITRILDYRIVKIAKKYRFTYTRYADDLTFSTNRNLHSNKLKATKELDKFLEELEELIVSSGFEINSKKTRLSDDMQRQEVTGLIVNKKLNVKREYIKNTRAMAFKLYKDEAFEIDGKQGTIEQLTGRFAFIFQIGQYNNYLLYKKSLVENNLEAQKNLLGRNLSKKSDSKYYWKYIFYNRDLRKELFYNKQHKTHNLPEEFYSIGKEEKKMYMALFDSKEKEYKKFLFYKYFYGNSKPIIVTEGKTDPRYIKAALKNLYPQYPELIERDGDKFIFKIDFLKHSNTIEYLFNVPEGGEGFNYWYNYFSNKEDFKMSAKEKLLYPNYIEYFQKLTSRQPKHPTIFLFDNEPTGYPLYQFASYSKDLDISPNNLDTIRNPMVNYRINQKSSLYIMSTPLVKNVNSGSSSDIEDLLIAKQKMPTLYLDGQNKTFKKNGGFNYYGKEILSIYVLKYYQNFDFSEFIPLLNGIRDNILDYRK
ncbi:RNA-directed DNA polymerase [Streptococcus minor]|uniref:RNA-directed DNA polymerase n=1 Tax=Streptococcus minor TaxID=229549 RepID=A0A3P1VCS4_9STRE|nr:retron Ec67 family RNA-directed DNA polymerase/endonuclease [Streptococcus minor]RRD31578.1 RNA-directed DNA polymerase [Streptococcus minor]